MKTKLLTLLILIYSISSFAQSKKTSSVFNLPMSTVTIIEDALMIAMSGIMLFYSIHLAS